MASAKVDGENIVDLILSDLRAAGGAPDSYELVPIVADSRGVLPGFLIRAEEFGIPQCRHRVILMGVRRDSLFPRLDPLAVEQCMSKLDEMIADRRVGARKAEELLGWSALEKTIASDAGKREAFSWGRSRGGPARWRPARPAAQAWLARQRTSGALLVVAASMTV